MHTVLALIKAMASVIAVLYGAATVRVYGRQIVDEGVKMATDTVPTKWKQYNHWLSDNPNHFKPLQAGLRTLAILITVIGGSIVILILGLPILMGFYFLWLLVQGWLMEVIS